MSKSTINILLFTSFIVIMWVATELYFLSKKDLNSNLDQKLTPEILATFDPTLDLQTIEILKENAASAPNIQTDLPPVSPTPIPTPVFRPGASRTSVTPTP